MTIPRSNNQFVLHIVQALAVLFTASACSPSQRPHEEESDAGNDAGEDTDLVWDSGTDTDVLVLEPKLFFEDLDVEGSQPSLRSSSYDGTYIAVSRSDYSYEDPYNSENLYTQFITFPWDAPEDTMASSFAQAPPACGTILWNRHQPNSQPHPHPDGFLLLTAVPDSPLDNCEAVQTLWDTSANLLDGPHAFSDLFLGDIYYVLNPNGLSNGDGTVTTGSIVGDGTNDASDSTSATVHIDLDLWGEGGEHERLFEATIDWPFDPTGLDGKEIAPVGSGRNIYLNDGIYTVVGRQDTVFAGYTDISSNALITRIDTSGTVVQPLTQIADDMPPLPSGLEDTSYAWSFYTFESSGDAILEVAKTMYMDLEGFAEYDPSIANPYTIVLWSRTIDFDGTPLVPWTELVDYQTHIVQAQINLAWSGRYFAACYNEPFDTFKMIAMNEQGEPISAPIKLFWTVPPVENRIQSCDLVAIDEDTFVAILGVYTDPEQPYKNGLWATRVDVSIPIE